MCTALWDHNAVSLFGRTFDFEISYEETIVITPQKYVFPFRYEKAIDNHFAMIGVACVRKGLPLYYDAVNDAGLAMASLHFPGYAHYQKVRSAPYNVASYELIWWILAQCRSVQEARSLLKETEIISDAADATLPATPLHWMIADEKECMVIEPLSGGLQLYDNPIGVMTNAPDFPYHITRLSDYIGLCAQPPINRLCPKVRLPDYTRGLGAMGLPGDWSSVSRFVRATYALQQTQTVKLREEQRVEHFFHMMDAVAVPRGCVRTDEGYLIETKYTSCMNLQSAEYYYTTYNCRAIRSVSMQKNHTLSDQLLAFPME